MWWTYNPICKIKEHFVHLYNKRLIFFYRRMLFLLFIILIFSIGQLSAQFYLPPLGGYPGFGLFGGLYGGYGGYPGFGLFGSLYGGYGGYPGFGLFGDNNIIYNGPLGILYAPYKNPKGGYEISYEGPLGYDTIWTSYNPAPSNDWSTFVYNWLWTSVT